MLHDYQDELIDQINIELSINLNVLEVFYFLVYFEAYFLNNLVCLGYSDGFLIRDCLLLLFLLRSCLFITVSHLFGKVHITNNLHQVLDIIGV